MLLKPFIAAAGLAAAAQALLLPPEITQSDVDIVNAIPDITQIDPESIRHVNLPCPGCLAQHRKNKPGHSSPTKAVPERPVHLEMTFSIRHDHGKEGRLVTNIGATPAVHELYPGGMSETMPMVGHLAYDNPGEIPKKLGARRSGNRYMNRHLGYSLTTLTHPASKDDGLQLIDVKLEITKVGRYPIEGIPTVHIKLVKDTVTGALVIGSIEKVEPQSVAAGSKDRQGECTSFMCKWLSVMKDKASKMKGKCGGMGKTGSRPPPSHHHQGGRPHKDHHYHHGNPNRHGWGELFQSIATHILLPVAVGIIAGVVISVIGMVVGHVVVAVWRVFFRRPGHRRTRSRSHSGAHKAPNKEAVAAEAEEKAGLMENQEGPRGPPPAYEDDARDVPV